MQRILCDYGLLSCVCRMLPTWLVRCKNRKTWESVPVARPAHQALALPILSERATKKPTPILLYSSTVFRKPKNSRRNITYPWASTVALFFWQDDWICEIQMRQKTSACKRLSNMSWTHPSVPFSIAAHQRGFAHKFKQSAFLMQIF